MKIHKIICVVIGIALMGTVLVSCAKPEPKKEEVKEDKKEIVIWYWSEEIQKYTDWYTQEINPNVTFDIVTVQSNEYYQKWIQTYLSGGQLPDIAVMEITYRQNLINIADAWEDLEQEPYSVNREDLFEYTIAQTTTENDELVSIEMGLTPVALGYKADLAQRYLGVSEPEEMEKLLSNWEELLTKGQEVNNQTKGEVFMFANTDELISVIKAHQDRGIVDAQGVINEEILISVISSIKEVYDRHLIDLRLYNDSDGINATISGDKVLFCMSPIWGPDYIIKKYDPDSMGRWRLMEIPGGNISMGGSSLAISKSSEVKEEAFDFINHVFLTQDGADMMAAEMGALSAYKDAYIGDVGSIYGEENEYFGGQDIISKFIDIAEDLPEQIVLKYSGAEDAAIKASIEAMIMNQVTLEEMVDVAKDRLIMEIDILKEEEQ